MGGGLLLSRELSALLLNDLITSFLKLSLISFRDYIVRKHIEKKNLTSISKELSLLLETV